MVNKWLIRAQRWLYPPRCLLCGADGMAATVDLCRPCRQDLPLAPVGCPVCAAPAAGGRVCGACQQRPPAFDSAVCALTYSAGAAWLIQRFKFGGRLEYGAVLGRIMAEELHCGAVDLIVPVPLHRHRLQERGFNQAAELARWLAEAGGAPVSHHAVQRVRNTPAQSGLSARQRRRNVRGAFVLRQPLAGLRVAVVDDVLTTGQTVDELARVMKRGGAAAVHVWCCARAGAG